MSSQQSEQSNLETIQTQLETTERQLDAIKSGDRTGRMLSNILGYLVDIAIVLIVLMLILSCEPT